MRSWGYAGSPIGGWSGGVEIPSGSRQPPLTAAIWLVERAIGIARALHVPRQLQLSWGEYDQGGQELAYHELEEFAVTDFDAIAPILTGLSAGSRGIFAMSHMFITMDTAIVGDAATSRAESSAELQMGIVNPEFEPHEAYLNYRTFIDIWLPITRDETGASRSNAALSVLNLPRLKVVLSDLKALAGESFEVEGTKFGYHQFWVDQNAV